MNKLERMTIVAAVNLKRFQRQRTPMMHYGCPVEDVLNLAGLNGADINYAKVKAEVERRVKDDIIEGV